MGTSLPPREANQFKLIVKAYETKQYKKGIKAADAILKKFPEHGETLAMKGLVLNCMEKKTEAYDYVRKGLKYDVKSHVCWHVYGLLYRSDRKYRDAIKCYLNALRIDPQNQQILKDLSLLQVQMRDKAGFVESRRQLLTLRPNQRNNWLAFAVAQHLNGSYDMALRTLEAYEGTVEDEAPANERYEQSELVLYKVRIMEEAGKLEEALKEMAKQDSKIVDRLGMREQRASLLLKLGRPGEAKREYEDLLDINPDNYRYIEGLQSCLGLRPNSTGTYSPEQVSDLKKLFSRLGSSYPKSAALKRIPLDFLTGEDFKGAVLDYICSFIRKGVPSLFSDIQHLYKQPGKADILDEVLRVIETELLQHNRLPEPASSTEDSSTVTSESTSDVTQGSLPNGVGGEEKGRGEGKLTDPTWPLWMMFLKAQHHRERGRMEEAMAAVNAAISYTPTVPDLYLVKARILQDLGDYTAAASLADSARLMDLSDRFLNSEATQMMLRADEADVAEKTAALFTKHGDQHENLFDMQCMWYELASGDSYLRQKNYGKALKNYLAVNKHYNDMVEDQFDFHTYCLRKMTLRAYLDMLTWEDKLHSFPSFCHAARGLIRCYLDLIDMPKKKEETEGEGVEDQANLSAAEKRKLRQKQRKAENKAKKEAEEKKKEDEVPAGEKAKKSGPGGRAVDPDPDGLKLLEEEDKLGKCSEYLTLLLDHAGDDVATHELAFEVAKRKNKLLLCLQLVKRMQRAAPDHPSTHRCKVTFFYSVLKRSKAETEAAQLVDQVIELEREDLGVPGTLEGLTAYNNTFFEQNKGSLAHRAAAAQAEVLLDPSRKEQALDKIEEAQEPVAGKDETKAPGVGLWCHEELVATHKLMLSGPLADARAAERWKMRCMRRFPYSIHFGGAKSSANQGIPKEADLCNGTHEEK